MSDGFQYGDIIFLGLIALFVGLRLRSMLGRGGPGVEPREVWKQAARDILPEKSLGPILERMGKKPAEEEALPAQLLQNAAVAPGLKAIRAADAHFSTTDFLIGAKLAFEWLLDAFSKGDKDKLSQLLSEERYRHFAEDIDTRAKDGLKHETTLVSVLATDITEAHLQGTRAQITVQFTTEQVSVTRSPDGKVVGGDASNIEKVIDVWTFERDIASRDPNWKVTAT